METDKIPYTISTINPDTGRSDDLLSTVRAAHVMLHNKAVDRAKSRVGQFPLKQTLEEAGFTSMTPHFMLLLYELGVVKKVKRSDKMSRKESCWEYLIAPFAYVDAMVSQTTVTSALHELAERQERNRAVQTLKKLQDGGGAEPEKGNSGPTLEQLAEAVAAFEEAEQKVVTLQQQLVEVEAKLAAAEQIDSTAVAEQLLAKVRKK